MIKEGEFMKDNIEKPRLEIPRLEIIKFDADDVIQTSGVIHVNQIVPGIVRRFVLRTAGL